MLDVVRLDFDPTIALFGLTVRLETLALAAVILIVLVLAALGAGRMRARLDEEAEGSAVGWSLLRRDDLLLISFGAVPGAVVGGRIGYGLVHLDYYRTDLGLLANPGEGGLTLTLAVVLGALGALAVARLLAAPIDRWLHIAAGPLLIGLGLGKLGMVLGADGQGQFSSASWATVYTRPGQWQSPSPGSAALPSQVLEGGLVLLAAALMIAVPFLLRLRFQRWRQIVRPVGLGPRREWAMLTGFRRFLTALCLWAVARFAAAFTWRDAQVLGPLGAEQLLLVGVLAGCLAVFIAAGLRDRRRARAAAEAASRAAARRVELTTDGSGLPEPRPPAEPAPLK